jgi:hypothetical protein
MSSGDGAKTSSPVDLAADPSGPPVPGAVHPPPVDADKKRGDPSKEKKDDYDDLSDKAVDKLRGGDLRRFGLGVVAALASIAFAIFGLWYGASSVPEIDKVMGQMNFVAIYDPSLAQDLVRWYLVTRALVILASFATSLGFFRGAQALSRSQFIELKVAEKADLTPKSLSQDLTDTLNPVIDLLKEIVNLKKS